MFYELFLYLFYFTIIRLWNVTKRPVIEPVGIWGKRKIHELFMQLDNKVLKLQQKIAENISKWPTYTIDPWTTWFWMVWVHLQADFFFFNEFQYRSTVLRQNLCLVELRVQKANCKIMWGVGAQVLHHSRSNYIQKANNH